MKKTVLALLLISNIGLGQAQDWDDPSASFDASTVQRNPISVTWMAVENVQKTCDAESRKRGNFGFQVAVKACSFWEGNSCTIITSRRPNMHSIGHEVRHCFQGNWH